MLTKCSESLYALVRLKNIIELCRPLMGRKCLDTDAIDCPANTDDALHYVPCLIFDRSYSLMLNQNLYIKGEELSQLLHHAPERGRLPPVFQHLPNCVVVVFKGYLPVTAYAECYSFGRGWNASDSTTSPSSYCTPCV